MKIDQFLTRLPTLWDSAPQNADHPRDRRFLPVLEATRGMATENKLALLNLAAGCLDDDEIYVEVGAWAGCSIIGASLGHSDKRFVAIDDFSQFGGPIDEFRANVEAFGAHHVELINGNVWDVLASRSFSRPIGVYFYDGGHAFHDQYQALKLIEPMLADEALVIIDDTAWPQVSRANRLYVRRRPQFEKMLRYESARNGEPRWWNGVEVYVFRRAMRPGIPERLIAAAIDDVTLLAISLAARPSALARLLRRARRGTKPTTKRSAQT